MKKLYRFSNIAFTGKIIIVSSCKVNFNTLDDDTLSIPIAFLLQKKCYTFLTRHV